jgi:predicted Zn-dependent peptidase
MFAIANIGVEPADLEASMNAIINDVRENLISEREYQKVLNQIENDFITSNNTVAGIAESLANYKMYFGDANLINTEIERYRKVTREDIRRVAREYFKPDSRVVLYWLPQRS